MPKTTPSHGSRPSFLMLLAALWSADDELTAKRFKKYKPRQRNILQALHELGGAATTRDIATRLSLNVNGVSQSLGALDCVECLGGKGGETNWRFKS